MLLFEEIDDGCVGCFLLLVGEGDLFGLLLFFGLDLVNKLFDNVVLGFD